MKKLFAILLAVMMLASMATVASAASTTTLTTTVPAASYTLNIPADQTIPFGEEDINIGELKVTGSSGFAAGKNLKVIISFTDFTCDSVNTTIPFKVYVTHTEDYPNVILTSQAVTSGGHVIFNGKNDGTVSEYVAGTNGVDDRYMWVCTKSADWGKALAGEYTATITFTAEVVAE